MMHNHGNGNIVYTLKRLIELSNARGMPGIRPQIQMSWKGDVKDAEQEQNGEKGGESLNHFFPWSSWEVWAHR